MMKALVWIVWCLPSCLSLTQDLGQNTLEFQYTMNRGPNGQLDFHQTTLFDGEVIFYCNSTILTDKPRQEWVTETFSLDELKDRNEYCRQQYYEHNQWFQEIDHIINEILQRRRGCKASGLSIFAFDEWAVNGEEFLTFEHEALRWTPASELAVPVALKWNKEDVGNINRKHVYRDFDQRVCDESRIKLKSVTKTQNKKTGVEVRIISKSIKGSTLIYLKCHVTGTGLSGVNIWLTKNEVPLTSGVNLIGPLPNGDGTVQMNIQAQLEWKDAEGYQCHVQSDTEHACLKWGELPCLERTNPPAPLYHDSGLIFYGLRWFVATILLIVCLMSFCMYFKHKQQAESAVKARVMQDQIRLLFTITASGHCSHSPSHTA